YLMQKHRELFMRRVLQIQRHAVHGLQPATRMFAPFDLHIKFQKDFPFMLLRIRRSRCTSDAAERERIRLDVFIDDFLCFVFRYDHIIITNSGGTESKADKKCEGSE